jgi:LacI family transcriptional regulator
VYKRKRFRSYDIFQKDLLLNIVEFSRELGVSISTVSKALNNYPDVSDRTKERILKAAKERGYQPSSSARSLRRKGTERIGLLYLSQKSSHWLTSMTADYFMRLLTGITRTAEEKMQNLMLYTTHWLDDPDTLMRISHRKEVDGLLVLGGGSIDSQLQTLRSIDMPWLLLGRKSYFHDVSWLQPDNFQAGYLAAAHLLDKGHTSIAYIGQEDDKESNDDRLAGFCKALEERGVEYNPALKVSAPFEPAGGRLAVSELYARNIPFSGACFFSDGVFFDSLPLLKEMGVGIPDDLAVVGFQDTIQGQLVPPGLTTIHVALESLGQWGVKLLNTMIEDPGTNVVQEASPVTLIERGTT